MTILAVQKSETDPATTIVLHEPSIETLAGNYHPLGNLYEGQVDYSSAKEAHRRLSDLIARKYKIEALDVKTLLASIASEKLIALAESSLEYELGKEASREDQIAQRNYKTSVLKSSTPTQLVNIILMQPTVRLEKDGTNTDYIVKDVIIHPLSNLCFSRDQQIITDKGVVMGIMQSPVRSKETMVMKAIWNHLNVNVMELTKGKLEGGDFLPMGEIAFLGIGLRTTLEAAIQLMEEKYIGYRRVVLVVDENDRSHQRMHLDTIFNIVTKKAAVLLKTVIDGSHSRKIRVFDRNDEGEYTENREYFHRDFAEYLLNELKLQIIPVSEKHQEEYLINFLNLGTRSGKSVILSVHPELKTLLDEANLNESKLEVEYLEFSGMTAMYGATHCSTQVIRAPL